MDASLAVVAESMLEGRGVYCGLPVPCLILFFGVAIPRLADALLLDLQASSSQVSWHVGSDIGSIQKLVGLH